jgi:rod shape determining protein RodA
MKNAIFEIFDYTMFVCVLILVTMGVMFIYSSGINSEGVCVSYEYVKQIIWTGIGLVLMILVSMYDFRRFQRFAPALFGLLCIILLYTRIFGRYVNGARSWLGVGAFGIQPSEFCKIIYILFLAWYLEKSQTEDEKKRFIIAIGILAVPLCLILLQPDLGTASVYIPIFLVMCFVAGFPVRYLGMLFFAGMLTIVLTVLPIWESAIAHQSIPVITVLTNTKLRLLAILATGSISVIGMIGKLFFKQNKYYYWIAYCSGIFCCALVLSLAAGHVLKDYQIQRLIVFLDPSSDPRGSGWNIIQSKIAIGSGNVTGQGFLHGTQSHYRFLPQQSTDFIFSILAEETGFLGCLLVFVLYLTIILRTLTIMKGTNSVYGLYIASGIFGMFLFHFIVNVGMVMGIMPITGIPLLFLSYGGSSLWTAMICIGLLTSINYRRLEF